jgi:hypothetical protein
VPTALAVSEDERASGNFGAAPAGRRSPLAPTAPSVGRHGLTSKPARSPLALIQRPLVPGDKASAWARSRAEAYFVARGAGRSSRWRPRVSMGMHRRAALELGLDMGRLRPLNGTRRGQCDRRSGMGARRWGDRLISQSGRRAPRTAPVASRMGARSCQSDTDWKARPSASTVRSSCGRPTSERPTGKPYSNPQGTLKTG